MGRATRATTCSSLRALVRDGVVPLLGPPTSIGDVHHGALYYYLLAPAALLTGGDSPLAVVALIALAGIAAVGVTWWLARSIGGPVAGFVAGLAHGRLGRRGRRVDVHLEPEPHRAVERDRAGRRVAGVVHGGDRAGGCWPRSGRRSRCSCHVLGVALLPVVAALLVADVRRAPAAPSDDAAC